MAGASVRVIFCSLPVPTRFFSARVTWEPDGLTRAGVLPDVLQAASAPAPAAPSPASRTERRLVLFTM